jgi:hypothetical protein
LLPAPHPRVDISRGFADIVELVPAGSTGRREQEDRVLRMKTVAVCAALLGALVAARPASAQGNGSAPPPAPPAKTYSQAQLEQMVAPIALYPDALVSQILIASTYPIQVVEAYQWLEMHRKPSSAQMQQAAKAKGWDPSVQSLLSFPQVVDRMYQNLQWTQELGEAFLAQQGEVMSTIQVMRHKAYAAGNLKSSKQQTVTVEPDSTIVIVPAEPQVVYVPAYNPVVVYGAAWVPATWYYPPAVYAPWPGYNAAAASAIAFGAGVAVGAIWGSSYCSWSTGSVYVTNNYYVHGGTYHAHGAYYGPNGAVAHYGNTTAAYNANTGHVESYNSATGVTRSGQVHEGAHGTAVQGENGTVAHAGNTTAGYDKNTGQYASYNSATGKTRSGTVDHGANGTAVQGSNGTVAHAGNTTAGYDKNTGQYGSYNSATGKSHSGNVNTAGSSPWQHDSAQRMGQPYGNGSLDSRYGFDRGGAARGYGEGGGQSGSPWASRLQGFERGDGGFDRAASDRGWASRGLGGGGFGGGFARGGFRR